MKNYIYILICICCGWSCQNQWHDDLQAHIDSLPDEIDFNFHVKPILSDRCFACHGPDEQKREAELRLDIEDNAFQSLASGVGKAIIKGNPHKSQVVKRIVSEEMDYMMPPPESNLSLSAEEKAIIIKWIDQGADYKSHWAFTKAIQSLIPQQDAEWPRNEIDHFVLDKLSEHSLTPSSEADKEQLIRRAYFDITGLPPSLEDLSKWLTAGDDFYELMIDGLLSSPAYGERMAAHWLDIARFADTEGYLDDFHHAFWPYRDWLIDAYNKNLPYDDFILWQVGGDQIPNASQEQILATAFNRNHKQNSEGGIIPEQFRVEYVADRTNTVGTGIMGLAVGCARCHDHKYDPISQKEYFQLYSFFNSTVERGDAVFGYNAVERNEVIPNELSMNSGPVLALASDEVTEIRNYLLTQITDQQDEIADSSTKNKAAFEKWIDQASQNDLIKSVTNSTLTHLSFEDMADGKGKDLVRSNKPPHYWGTVQSTPGKIGQGILSDAGGQYVSDGMTSRFERYEPFTISFWINIPKTYNEGHVMYNGNNRIQGYRGWDVVVDSTRVHFRLNHAHPYQSIDISSPDGLKLNEWTHFVWSHDGSATAEGMTLYQNGNEVQPSVHRNYLYRSTKAYTDDRATVYMSYQGLIIGNRHYDQDFTGGKLDEIQILNQEADEYTAMYLYHKDQALQTFNAALSDESGGLRSYYNLFVDNELEGKRQVLRELQQQELMAIDTVRELMVMGDSETQRPTYILERGVWDAQGEPVERDVPTAILPWPEDLPKNRYGLGKWLVHEDHPLTARVAVNQYWYLLFGKGIVESVEDFGNQSVLPTHPELLDWLAVDFQENGWDLKRLIKMMVMSSTYRQSSVIRPDVREADPHNKLLASGPRYRRSAEMIRDNILAASGLLNPHIGGPSTFPYQPDGLWKEAMTHTFFPEYEIDYDKGLYRRSLYTFWKRLMPPPNMLIFDATDRNECQVRRDRSNTPLQALVLLNDPQVIEGSRVLAERMYTLSQGDVEEATTRTFKILTSREPTTQEQALLTQQYHDELIYFQQDESNALAYLDVGSVDRNKNLPLHKIAALSRVTNTILNSTEAYYKN